MSKKQILSALILGIILLRLLSLGSYALMDNTESRYAEIAREMVRSGDWVTLQLDPGHPFWAKPPLSTWLAAGLISLFGLSEWSVRFPSFILMLLTSLCVYRLAQRRKNGLGMGAMIILWSSGLFFVMAGVVMTDPALTASVTLTLTAFIICVIEEGRKTQRPNCWGYLFFVGLALGALSKGPLSMIIIGFAVVGWALITNKWRRVWEELPWGTGLILMVLIAFPWHWLAEQKTPGFLEYYIIGEHFQRFLISDWQGDLYGSAHPKPRGIVWLFCFVAFLPWSALWLTKSIQCFRLRTVSLRNALISDPWALFLFLWALGPLLIFTLARNISFYYILPSLIPLAMLFSWYNSDLFTRDKSKVLVSLAAGGPVIIFMASMLVLPHLNNQFSQKNVAKAFMYSRTTDQARLHYLQEELFSADLYTDGRADSINDFDFSRLWGILTDSFEDFYAVRKEQLMVAHPELEKLTYEVAAFDDIVLLRERGWEAAHPLPACPNQIGSDCGNELRVMLENSMHYDARNLK